jgi:KUP system potassium uptake protein
VSPRTLLLGAIGVVFGDIGTSPLYTLREAFGEIYGLEPDRANVLGVLSLVFWAMMLIVTIKYVLVILRADNRGEGGVLALTALVSTRLSRESRLRWWLAGLGIFGAAMFFGDAMITPAVSVLGALEGISVVTDDLQPYIVPLAIVILLALFAIQKHGTASVGVLFGPICALWFVVLAVLGGIEVAGHPIVLEALSPAWAVRFVFGEPLVAFLSLGAVVLAVTGTEALYADMGHFGRTPIRRVWVYFVLPALVLNYFGQGALLLTDPKSIANPFYLLAPSWATVPLVILATAAAVIASQAVISGAFSIARAAVQMGYCPRIAIRHTSEKAIGQIYVPFVNWSLLFAVLLLVVGFQDSTSLAGAYGFAVTMSMLIDSILIYFVMRRLWHWPLPVALAIAVPLGLIDAAFLSSNLLKIPYGGWFPLIVGIAMFTLLTTWKRGRKVLFDRLSEDALPLKEFIQSIELAPPVRVEGTAVFLTSTPDKVPHALLHNLKHNKVLHERVVFLTVVTREIPFVQADERIELETLGCDFYRMLCYYGFKEEPDVPELLEEAGRNGFPFEMMETSFFVSRETLIPSVRPGMARWRERLFSSMSKNAVKASDFFHVPTNRVVELGTQVEL